MQHETLDDIDAVSAGSPENAENDHETNEKNADSALETLTKSCPYCGKQFSKDTEARVNSALRLHIIRGHRGEPIPDGLVGSKDRRQFRHGLSVGTHGTGTLPAGCSHIRAAISQLRGLLEDAAISRHGSITDPMRLLIQTALRWEQHSQLCRRWLNAECGALPLEKRIELSNQIATASDKRDRSLERLGLHDWSDRFGSAETLYAVAEPTTNKETSNNSN